MGSSIWTEMRIGGKATRKVWDALLAAIEDGCWDNRPGALDAIAQEKMAIQVSGETKHGAGAGLPEFCRAHGLAYCLTCDGEIETWAPGWDAPICRSTLDGQPAIALPQLRQALKDGKTLGEIIAHLDTVFIELPAVEIAPDDRPRIAVWSLMETIEGRVHLSLFGSEDERNENLRQRLLEQIPPGTDRAPFEAIKDVGELKDALRSAGLLDNRVDLFPDVHAVVAPDEGFRNV